MLWNRKPKVQRKQNQAYRASGRKNREAFKGTKALIGDGWAKDGSRVYGGKCCGNEKKYGESTNQLLHWKKKGE